MLYNTQTTSFVDVTLVHHLLSLEDILVMHAVDALGYVDANNFINATTTTTILVNGSFSSPTSYPLSGQSCCSHLQNFVSLPHCSDLTIELFRIEQNGGPGLDLVMYNTYMVWECCIIQWYNTTGIIPQLYIHTYRYSIT